VAGSAEPFKNRRSAHVELIAFRIGHHHVIVGHWLQHERRDEVSQILTSWLASLPA
jgi:uncharacterized protein YacL (UPF0231 family)